MAVGDVYQVDLRFTIDERPVSFCAFYEETVVRAGTIAEVTLQTGQSVVALLWTSFWQSFASNELVFNQVKTQMIYPTREAPIFDASDAGSGSQIKQGVTAFAAVLIAEYGSVWGRRFQGRVFLPGLPQEDEVEGEVEAATFASIQTSATTNMLLPIPLAAPASATMTPGVFSPKQKDLGLTPVISPLQTVIARKVLRTQVRRRRPTQVV